MKKPDGSITPIEPDNHKALAKVLQEGGQAKVKMAGSDRLFIMQKAEKSKDYELFECDETPKTSGQLQQALLAAQNISK